MSITIQPMSASDVPTIAPRLAELLVDAVDGATLGFIEPVPYDEALAYWLKIGPELVAGTRILLVARDGDRIVGSGQLSLTQAPNARHRADVQKVFVDKALRGRGVGRQIMEALHDVARAHGRCLLMLTARAGAPAERMYRALGYQEVGKVPGYAMGYAGERYDNWIFRLELP